MFTALAATIRTVTIDTSDSKAMSAFATLVSGIVSVGLKAVAFVSDR